MNEPKFCLVLVINYLQNKKLLLFKIFHSKFKIGEHINE